MLWYKYNKARQFEYWSVMCQFYLSITIRNHFFSFFLKKAVLRLNLETYYIQWFFLYINLSNKFLLNIRHLDMTFWTTAKIGVNINSQKLNRRKKHNYRFLQYHWNLQAFTFKLHRMSMRIEIYRSKNEENQNDLLHEF